MKAVLTLTVFQGGWGLPYRVTWPGLAYVLKEAGKSIRLSCGCKVVSSLATVIYWNSPCPLPHEQPSPPWKFAQKVLSRPLVLVTFLFVHHVVPVEVGTFDSQQQHSSSQLPVNPVLGTPSP